MLSGPSGGGGREGVRDLQGLKLSFEYFSVYRLETCPRMFVEREVVGKGTE